MVLPYLPPKLLIKFSNSLRDHVLNFPVHANISPFKSPSIIFPFTDVFKPKSNKFLIF